jgi:hypothetical protein
MNESEYLETRVIAQINYYDRKSVYNKKWFTMLRIGETILALLIPFLTGYITNEPSSAPIKFIVGLAGVLVAAAANLVTMLKFQENWVNYRSIEEALRHEHLLYLTKAGAYKDSGSFPVFVESIESIIARENSSWLSYIKTTEKPATN